MATKNRKLPIVLLLTCILGAVAASAQSGILSNPNAFPFTFNCGGQQVTVVTVANAANALVTTNNSVMIATSLTQVTSYIDPTTGQPVTQTLNSQIGAGHGQATGISDLTTCVSAPITVQDPQLGTETITLTIVAFFTPR
jgi:hypothetical protein